jgi:hypothetical protein
MIAAGRLPRLISTWPWASPGGLGPRRAASGQVPIKNRLSLLDGDFGGEGDPPTVQGFGSLGYELHNH